MWRVKGDWRSKGFKFTRETQIKSPKEKLVRLNMNKPMGREKEFQWDTRITLMVPKNPSANSPKAPCLCSPVPAGTITLPPLPLKAADPVEDDDEEEEDDDCGGGGGKFVLPLAPLPPLFVEADASLLAMPYFKPPGRSVRSRDADSGGRAVGSCMKYKSCSSATRTSSGIAAHIPPYPTPPPPLLLLLLSGEKTGVANSGVFATAGL